MSYEYQVNAHLSNEDADEFIKENPYNFNEEEINVTKDFKKHVKSNFLMIVGFLKIILKFLLKMYSGLLLNLFYKRLIRQLLIIIYKF